MVAMKDLPNPFWAAMFILMASVVAVIALVHPNVPNVTMAVVAIASNIISGSFGYISGHRDGATQQPAPPAADPVDAQPAK